MNDHHEITESYLQLGWRALAFFCGLLAGFVLGALVQAKFGG